MKNDLAALREALAKVTAENTQLTARLGDMESRLAANSVAGAQAALALAIANLNRTLATADPYSAPLAALKEIVANDSELNQKVATATEPIAGFGDRGVPTLAVLASSFPAAADGIARAAAKSEDAGAADAEQGFFDKAWRKVTDGVSDAVSVRPEGEAEGDGPLERLARAEVRLSEHKLAEAVAELDGLTGAPREAAAAWLNQAKARLAVDAAMETLSALALTRLPDGSAGNAGG
jgi:hypothetical protein